VFHASSVLGVGLAALAGSVLVAPGAWRWGFLLSLAPAVLIVWIRWHLREPQQWRQAKRQASAIDGPRASAGAELGSLAELLGDRRWRPRALIGLGLAAVGLGTYWGIFAWGPELAGAVLGADVAPGRRQELASRAYLLMNFTGGLLGLLAFAPLASWRGRRFAFAVFHLGAIAIVPVTFLGARTYPQALALLPVMAFFVVGMHAGYAIYFPELFPTRLRATGSSFCFNVGRILAASVLLIRGALGERLGLRYAVTALASVFLIGLVLLVFAPETRGQDLPQ
jgi:MFS family permease